MNNIFRKKSYERLQSPDDLNEYMKVVTPPVWFALSAVILLLAGAIIFGISARLETKRNGIVVKNDDGTVCYIKEEDAKYIGGDSFVRINGVKSDLLAGEENVSAYTLTQAERSFMGISGGDDLRVCEVEGEIENGRYKAEVVLESVSPLSFLFSSNQ